MVVKELAQGAGPLLDGRQRRQSLLNGLSDGLRRVRPRVFQRQVFNRTERTALPMLPGDDPCLMPAGLDAQDEAPNEDVPHFVGFGLGLRLGDKTLGQGDTHAGHRCRVDAQSVGWPGLRCLDKDGPRYRQTTVLGWKRWIIPRQVQRDRSFLAIDVPVGSHCLGCFDLSLGDMAGSPSQYAAVHTPHQDDLACQA